MHDCMGILHLCLEHGVRSFQSIRRCTLPCLSGFHGLLSPAVCSNTLMRFHCSLLNFLLQRLNRFRRFATAVRSASTMIGLFVTCFCTLGSIVVSVTRKFSLVAIECLGVVVLCVLYIYFTPGRSHVSRWL